MSLASPMSLFRKPAAALEGRAWAALALAALAVIPFSRTLGARSFIRDDRWIVAENPVLRARGAWRRVWTTGYWEAARGAGAPVAEYRPVTMTTHLADRRAFGDRPGPMHALSLALHAVNALLVRAVLARFGGLGGGAAWLGAAFFAVMPVHAEAVCGLVGRAELLAAALSLWAWLLLGAPPHGRGALALEPSASRVVLGTSAYLLACLSKEHAILLPVVIALSDRAVSGVWPWDPRRRGVHGALAAAAALAVAARFLVLDEPFRGGEPYFAGVAPTARLLTVSRFWVERYLWPAATGLNLGTDFSRPLVPDSGPRDLRSWACLAALCGALLWAARSLFERRPDPGSRRAAFWVLYFPVFLLPTSNLLLPLDTLGAQRFLYLPSLAPAAAAGILLEKLRARADPRLRPGGSSAACGFGLRLKRASTARTRGMALAAAVLAWSATRSWERSALWTDSLLYYQETLRQNPASVGAGLGLGLALLEKGRRESAWGTFVAISRAYDSHPGAFYNLGKMAWEEGERQMAEMFFKEALARDPASAPALSFLGLAAEERGDAAAAEGAYRRALELEPLYAVASYNLGRLLWTQQRRREAAPHLARFLELAPDDPDAAAVGSLLAAGPVERREPGRPPRLP